VSDVLIGAGHVRSYSARRNATPLYLQVATPGRAEVGVTVKDADISDLLRLTFFIVTYGVNIVDHQRQ
jgi:hypothetical protein